MSYLVLVCHLQTNLPQALRRSHRLSSTSFSLSGRVNDTAMRLSAKSPLELMAN